MGADQLCKGIDRRQGAKGRAAGPEPGRRQALAVAPLEKAHLPRIDLKGANLARTDLREANLTQQQVDAAIGDERTRLPEGLTRPAHWSKAEAVEPPSATE